MRIQSSTSNLQMLKAQQAWEARRAAKTGQTMAPQAPQPNPKPSQTTPSRDMGTPVDLPVITQGPASPQWTRTVTEVQSIAEQAGYVGVTEQDIRRAYTYGESLLADYRI